MKKIVVPIIIILLAFAGIYLSELIINANLFTIPSGYGIAALSLSLLFLAIGIVLLVRPLSSKPKVQSWQICWFCKKRPADDNSKVIIKMHKPKKEEKSGLLPVILVRKIEYHPATVEIPRCEKCTTTQEHSKVLMALFVIIFWAFIGGAFVLRELYHTRGWLTVLIFGVCVLIPLIGYALIHLKITNDYDLKTPNEHPEVKKLEAQGYIHGEKPN